jgi:hypothetical protein
MFFTNSLAVMVDYRQQERRIRRSWRLFLRPYQLTWAIPGFFLPDLIYTEGGSV